MKSSRAFVALAAAGALTFALAACTPTQNGEPSPSASASPTVEPTLDPVLTLEGEVGAREDLTDFTCDEEGGTWSSSGTLTNPTQAAAVYVVNLGIIESDSRSSVLRKNVVVDVEAGQSSEFVEESLISDVPGVGHECVVRVSRGTAVQE